VPCFAAFLTVATLGFDAFVQQLLTTEVRVMPAAGEGISVNSTASTTAHILAAVSYPETKAQLIAAMLANMQQEEQPMVVMAVKSPASRAIKKRATSSGTETGLAAKSRLPEWELPLGSVLYSGHLFAMPNNHWRAQN
jgi:hypothetical protein